MNRLITLRIFTPVQARFFSRGRKGFIQNLWENLHKELESDKQIKENLEQFKKSTKELEQSEEFKKIRDLYKKMEKEIPPDTGDKLLSTYRSMMEKLQKETDELKKAEMIKKTLESMSKVTANLSLNLKDSEIVKQALKGAKAIENELRNERYRMYCPPDVLKTRYEVAGKVGHQRIIEANEEASGVELHKDSKWISSWNDFKSNNPYVLKIFDLKTRMDESDSLFFRSTRYVSDKLGGIYTGLVEKNEVQKVLDEVIKMDPSFTMASFLPFFQYEVVPNVLEAIVRGDTVILKDWCHEAVFNVLSAPIVQAQTHNHRYDGSVLDVSSVDLVHAVMLDHSPVLVMRFESQIVTVVRDKHGKVVEGDPNKCLRVVHTWAMCRDQSELNPWAAWRVGDLSMSSTEQLF